MSVDRTAELMIHALAREVRDGEISVTGTLSPLPAAACYLAQLTHAPRSRPVILHSPEWPFENELEDLFGLVRQGRVGLFFLSGAQIDRQANINLISIGDYGRPQVRLPGGAGSAMVYLQARVGLFLTNQTSRSLIEKVDFITAPGGPPSPERPGHTSRLVTNLAVFSYRAGQGLVLESRHPWVDPAELQAQTGFPLPNAAEVPETELPDQAILDLIHGPIKDKLAGPYPLFVKNWY